MKNKKVLDSLQKLESASQRLDEALAEETSNPLAIDGTIQRFEFVFELMWKTLKRALEAARQIFVLIPARHNL